MKEMCLCVGCVNDIMLGSGFYLAGSENGYSLESCYDIKEEKLEFYWKLIHSTIRSGIEVGQNRWIDGDDAYEDLDRTILSRAGVHPDNKDIEEYVFGDLINIGRSAFIAGVTRIS
jgi:hypothetical protein